MYTSTQEGTRDGTSVRDVMAPRVLVVDDERTVTEVVERYLRRGVKWTPSSGQR